jgi:hypothetical protein
MATEVSGTGEGPAAGAPILTPLEKTVIAEARALGFRVAPADAAAIGRRLRADGVGQDATGMEVRSLLTEDHLTAMSQSRRATPPPPPRVPVSTPFRTALQRCKDTGGAR